MDHETPLMLAIKSNRIDAAIYLISRGADWGETNGEEIALEMALTSDMDTVLKAAIDNQTERKINID